MHKRVIASASHYLLYVTGLHMHWPTCTARSSTSYQLPAASNQQTSAWHTVHVDYVFAAQPVLPIRHHMISLSGLSLVILVISSIFAMAKMRRRYERHSNEFPGDFFSWRGAVPPHQGYSIQGRARVLLSPNMQLTTRNGIRYSVPLDGSYRICPLSPSLYPTQSLIHR